MTYEASSEQSQTTVLAISWGSAIAVVSDELEGLDLDRSGLVNRQCVEWLVLPDDEEISTAIATVYISARPYYFGWFISKPSPDQTHNYE